MRIAYDVYKILNDSKLYIATVFGVHIYKKKNEAKANINNYYT